MSGTTTGALLGGALAITWLLAGFGAFLLVGLAMLVGAGIGRVADGRLDLRALASAFVGRRRSS